MCRLGASCGKEAAGDALAHSKAYSASLLDALSSSLACIEVILSCLSRDDFAVFGDFEALSIRFIGLHTIVIMMLSVFSRSLVRVSSSILSDSSLSLLQACTQQGLS